ncbi:MAG: hypothetical protein WC375_08280 [Methanomassiliicoccales archaeon]|jgi:hypothetical protein
MSGLLKLMMLEEYRLHISYSSKRMFLTMPLYVIIFTIFLGSTIGEFGGGMSIEDMVLMAHAGVFLYGMSVGAFGFLGRTYVERRYGKNNFLVATPFLLPLSFKRAYLDMFLRDLIYYSALMLAPAFVGLSIAGLIVGYQFVSVALLFIALFLSFLFGISFSFFVSVVYTRSVPAFLAAVGVFMAALFAYGFFEAFPLETILPPAGLQLNVQPFGSDISAAVYYTVLSVLASLAFIALALQMVNVERGSKSYTYKDRFSAYRAKLKAFRSYDALLAKELVDIRRSGMFSKLIFAYVAPLLFLGFSTWYINTGLKIPVGFNIIFYAGMVGFFGVMVYNWLTNTDLNDYYETMPVDVPMVIRTKLVSFLLLTTAISIAFVLLIAFMNGETKLLWLAIPVLLVTSIYMVTATAYLTGLRTSSFLFDPSVLGKFMVLAMVPDISITILSFSVDSSPTVAIAGIFLAVALLGAATKLFYDGIEKKWAREVFS